MKNALMFTQEFFENKDVMKNPKYWDSIIELINVVMPSALFKTIYEKGFIAAIARNSVTNALECCIFDELLDVLIDTGCNSTNKNL